MKMLQAYWPGMLDPKEKAFIKEHILDEVSTLLLQASRYKELDVKKLVTQIEARQKARYKLPEWYRNEDLFFPPALSVEQCSSEATARYKASLVEGQRLIDGSGGMGVDCYYMSQRFAHTDYVERNTEIADSAAFNFGQLGAESITVSNGDIINLSSQDLKKADWLYLDPARRDSEKRKVVLLQDCSPDVVSNWPFFSRLSPRLLLKTSPLLDIDQTTGTLHYVKEVHAVGAGEECKEVLYILDQSQADLTEPILKAVILRPDGQVSHSFEFRRSEEASAIVDYGQPDKFLYEPHPALLKTGAFKSIAVRFGLKKLAVNSHLYTSDSWNPDFPGRGFQITDWCKPNQKEIARLVPEGKANLTLRNFPAKINDLRKKWRLREGGDLYLFATTLFNGQVILIVTKKVN